MEIVWTIVDILLMLGGTVVVCGGIALVLYLAYLADRAIFTRKPRADISEAHIRQYTENRNLLLRQAYLTQPSDYPAAEDRGPLLVFDECSQNRDTVMQEARRTDFGSCAKTEDGLHCKCWWWHGEPCCSCGAE